MGSYRKAIMTGFICRLCSEQKKFVVHLYSKKAKEMNLMTKITFIPITIEKNDHLPKTLCQSCIEKLDMQYNLVQKIRKSFIIQRTHRILHRNGRCPVECPLHGFDVPSPPPSEIEDLEATVNDTELLAEISSMSHEIHRIIGQDSELE